jgi:Flp pilus assembly protein TadG
MAARRRTFRSSRAGSMTLEFAIAYAGVMLPMTFGLLFFAQLMWVWHSVNEMTRRGASYATTHCWQSAAGNVVEYMQNNIPPMIDQVQIQNGPAQIAVTYFSKDPVTGQLAPFQCDSECTANCIPDTVTVSVTGFQFTTFTTYLGLAPITIPNFQTSLAMEGAGCDPEQGVCAP